MDFDRCVFRQGVGHARLVSQDEVQARLRSGDWVRVRHGWYCTSEDWAGAGEHPVGRFALDVAAARRAVGEVAWVSRETMLRLVGLPTRDVARPHAIVVPPAGLTGRRYPGLQVRAAKVPHDHRTQVFGIPCTTTARSLADLAREQGFVDGLAAMDVALRSDATSSSDLDSVLGPMRGWPGVRDARLAVRHADASRESPLESWSYAWMVLADLPLPQCQVWVDESTRVDFLWPNEAVVGEADGRLKYAAGDADALWREKRRQERLERLGLRVVRWGADDLGWNGSMIGWIHAALASRPPLRPTGGGKVPEMSGRS